MKTLASLVLMTLSLAAQAESAAEFMRAFTWQQRVLLLFAPAAGDPLLAQQETILAAVPPGLAERDLAIVRVQADAGSVRVDGEPHDIAAAALYRHFAIDADGFHVILVGKDGGVKLARRQPVSAAALFDLIDAMPMRRREMRGDGG